MEAFISVIYISVLTLTDKYGCVILNGLSLKRVETNGSPGSRGGPWKYRDPTDH